MKPTSKKYGIAAGIILIIALILFLVWPKGNTQAQLQYETTRVEKDTIRNTVTATGTIEPVTSVDVGTQVSGIISKIYVDYNSIVKKGQVIAELDKTNLISELNSAQANLASAKNDLEYQKANYLRYKNLYEKGLISANDYEVARLSYTKAEETLKTNQENVNKAQTNLEYAIITSPIDGIVLGKDVEEGQTVASSYSTPTLFTIAQDLTDMRVIADIDEADIGGVKEGQNVTFTVDAFPNDIFYGQVTQVRQEATEESNVVTYEVVISAPNKDLKLKPGLTANVTINTLERTGVVSVKTKALRFTPQAEILGKSIKIEDCNGKNKLWIKNGNILKAYAVKIGVSDGIRTEIISGIPEGSEVIASVKEMAQEEPQDEIEGGSPFMPHPGKKK